MTSELDLRRLVREELSAEPSLHPCDLHVVVEDGRVTLHGTTQSYGQKLGAEQVVRRMRDVREVKNEIEVHVPLAQRRSDAQIADAVMETLRWNAAVPRDLLRARVVDGWVELRGTVPWAFQRAAAEAALQPLLGIRGVTNLIAVKPAQPVADKPLAEIKSRIAAALARRADIAIRDARAVEVETDGDVVVLRGKVRSWADRALIEAAVWGTPGVSRVDDELEVVTGQPELDL
jgi:osmotically-inducible protein OsmY